IDATAFLNANSANIESTLYFWRKTNGAGGSAYATYTAGGATTTTPTSAVPNGIIQVGQGFFVAAKKAATVTTFFTNSMRVANNANQIFKTKNVVEKDRVWINLTNANGAFSQMLVGYMDGATQGVDVLDGKYINDSSTALTSDINNEEYVIQARALPFDVTDVVNLNFKTDVAGTYTIAKDHVDGLFAAGQDIYLVDKTTGTETNLQTDSYTFTAPVGTNNARFSLKYQKTLKVNDATFDENSISVYKQNGVLNVNSGKTTMKSVKVFDIAGRLILEQKEIHATTTILKNLAATKQPLLIQIISDENKVVTKKAIY
ncbi:MAG: T9SS sorting signal type C domain-containing protein, partial [Flavobacterium sp.]|uniref:T9SS sorting signal type C domain-containing protein n=1 Tax=Flavobacterium sp. TaxID=239 RepID=UPI00260BDF26